MALTHQVSSQLFHGPEESVSSEKFQLNYSTMAAMTRRSERDRYVPPTPTHSHLEMSELPWNVLPAELPVTSVVSARRWAAK